MDLKFSKNGKVEFDNNYNLPPGIYELTIEEIEQYFSFSPKRKELIIGLKKMLTALKDIGCEKFYLDGSFASHKLEPEDFDGCWVINQSIDWDKIKSDYPELINYSPDCEEQKIKYLGEAYISNSYLKYDRKGKPVFALDYFQKDKSGKYKGIILLKL